MITKNGFIANWTSLEMVAYMKVTEIKLDSSTIGTLGGDGWNIGR